MVALHRPSIHPSYRAFIERLSDDLPLYGLVASDFTLSGPELALTIEHHGRAWFVSEAMGERCEPLQGDAFDAIAIRVTEPTLAVQGCGEAVVAAVHAYAKRLVLQDVTALRDQQSTPHYLDRMVV